MHAAWNLLCGCTYKGMQSSHHNPIPSGPAHHSPRMPCSAPACMRNAVCLVACTHHSVCHAACTLAWDLRPAPCHPAVHGAPCIHAQDTMHDPCTRCTPSAVPTYVTTEVVAYDSSCMTARCVVIHDIICMVQSIQIISWITTQYFHQPATSRATLNESCNRQRLLASRVRIPSETERACSPMRSMAGCRQGSILSAASAVPSCSEAHNKWVLCMWHAS